MKELAEIFRRLFRDLGSLRGWKTVWVPEQTISTSSFYLGGNTGMEGVD